MCVFHCGKMSLELGLENVSVGFLSRLWWDTVPSFRGIVVESPATMGVTPPFEGLTDYCRIRFV